MLADPQVAKITAIKVNKTVPSNNVSSLKCPSNENFYCYLFENIEIIGNLNVQIHKLISAASTPKVVQGMLDSNSDHEI